MPVDVGTRYPLTLDATLERPSRALWLVKWFLLIPHCIVLALLTIGLAVSWVVALIAIVATGRYPRPLFDYTVGVLRWYWRVAAYGYGLAGTDRYPPFTLDDVPDYPARLDIPYPEHLSRGLALVKWWLLAIPHYFITSLLYSGIVYVTFDQQGSRTEQRGAGIIGLLVFVALIVLLFRGSYPTSLFDLIVGLQRWGFRVGAYALLLTDAYPPFRLDIGGQDPAHKAPVAPPTGGAPLMSEPSTTTGPPVMAGPAEPAGPTPAAPLAPAPPRTERWTVGRLVALIAGALLVLTSGGLLLGAAGTAVADRTSRDAHGYLSTTKVALTAAGYALTSQRADVPEAGPAWAQPSWSLGTLRARVTGDDPGRPVFVGVARGTDVDRYLAGVAHSTVQSLENGVPTFTEVSGTAAPAPPGEQTFWVAQATGTDRVTLTWSADTPEWVLVVMNADATNGVRADADIGATLPILGRVTAGLGIAGVVVLVAGALLMVVAFRPTSSGRAPREVTTGLPA